jgi:hypothetical protein
MTEKLEKKIATEEKRLSDERKVFLDDMFNDLYRNRRRIYGLNFFRGVFFGLGTFLGGTVVVAFLIWLLSRFIDWPFVERLVETLQR